MKRTGKHHAQSRYGSAARRFIPPVLLLAGLSVFIMAFVVANTDDTTSLAVSGNPAIDRLIPSPNSEVLRQTQIGIDLAPGFEAELIINDVPIPPDQINVLRSGEDPDLSNEVAGAFSTTLNQFLYQPLRGRAVPQLNSDLNCVVATFWPIADPTNIETVEWCFTVS